MTQQISHLKEEIVSKDNSIISEEDKQKSYAGQNDTLSTEIDKIKRNIASSEEMIKT
jgi:septal ring factor EnvC (AmiA/AmiB activator)